MERARATLEQAAVMPCLLESIGDGNAIAETAHSTIALLWTSAVILEGGLRPHYLGAAAKNASVSMHF